MKKIFLFLMIAPFVGMAQNNPDKTYIEEIKVLHSNILNEDRTLVIYKPAGNTIYTLPPRFPVLYLLDAEWQAPMIEGQIHYLSGINYAIPKMLVVAIKNTDRTRDLTPTHSVTGYDGKTDTTSLKTSGDAEKFLQFMQNELIPYIEKNYNTEPYRILSGHSFGGLFALYSLLYNPDLFNGYLSISPSLWWDKKWILNKADKILTAETPLNKILFYSDGAEGGQFHKNVRSFDSLLQSKTIRELSFKYIYYPDETHNIEPVKAFYDGIRFIYHDWVPDEFYDDVRPINAETFTLHYQKLSRRYGYTILPPEEIINEYGYNLMNHFEKLEDAVDVFALNVKNYPNSYNAFDSYAESLMKTGNKLKAIENYEKSLQLNPGNENAKQMLAKLKGK